MAVLEEPRAEGVPRRYYDPFTAQFLTPDPLDAITGERYGYASNDPVNGSDPTGLWCVVHNSDGGCLGAGVAEDAASYAASWEPDCIAVGNSNCTSLGTLHPTVRDGLYVTAGAVATVASGGLALDAVGVSSVGVEGATFGSSFAAGVEAGASVGVGLIAASGDYGRCRDGDELACAGMVSGGIAAGLGVPAIFPSLAAFGIAGLPFALGALGIDEYGVYMDLYDRLAGCS